MLSTYERRRSQREIINEMPLYPTEGVLWDENQIPSVNYTGGSPVSYLRLQFVLCKCVWVGVGASPVGGRQITSVNYSGGSPVSYQMCNCSLFCAKVCVCMCVCVFVCV